MKLAFALISLIISYTVIYKLLLDNQADDQPLDKRQLMILGLVCMSLWLYNWFYSPLHYTLSYLFLTMVTISGLVDLMTSYIYDNVLLICGILILGVQWWLTGSPLASIYGVLAGFLFYGALYLIVKRIYQREAFGLGDVFLLAAMGTVLLPIKTIIAGFLAFYVAGIIYIIYALLKKRFNLKAELPFGPYIAIAGLLTLNHHQWLLMLYNGFNHFINGLF